MTADQAFAAYCARQFPIVHPESIAASLVRPVFVAGFNAARVAIAAGEVDQEKEEAK